MAKPQRRPAPRTAEDTISVYRPRPFHLTPEQVIEVCNATVGMPITDAECHVFARDMQCRIQRWDAKDYGPPDTVIKHLDRVSFVVAKGKVVSYTIG